MQPRCNSNNLKYVEVWNGRDFVFSYRKEDNILGHQMTSIKNDPTMQC